MKRYLVFLTDLALPLLQGINPRGGRTENFDEQAKVREFAESQKNDWDRVFIFDRSGIEGLERIEHYQHGHRYVGGVSANEL